MYKGGANYTPKSAKIIRYAGFLAPAGLITYGLLTISGHIEPLWYFNPTIFFVLSFFLTLLSVVQFLVPNQTKRDTALRQIAYHLLAAAYLLFITGVATPFAMFWIVLLLTSNTFFSKYGMKLSILGFVLVVSFDIFLWGAAGDLMKIGYDIVTLTAVLVCGVVALGISRAQEVDRTTLLKSKQQEILQRNRMLTIVNSLADAVLSTDKRGIIRIYNSASLGLLDTNDSLLGKHIETLVSLTDKAGKSVNLFSLLKNAKSSITRDDLTYTATDGEAIRLEMTYSPIRHSFSLSHKKETLDGYIIIIRDITKAKSLEEERDEFISVVSHELRTPITIVEGTISNAQLLLTHPNATPKMLSDSIETAHVQIVYLAKIVNDLSALSRAERGVADAFEDINTRDMIHKLHDQYNVEATAKKLRLDIDMSASLGHIFTSRLYIEEILQNFITNAIKYTKTGSVTIVAKQHDDVITFAVKDTGIGIGKSDQAKIFQKFYRSEDYRTRESSGTGLGLYVTTKLAHKVGTTIKFESRLNHGSTFSFEIPVQK